ncbi:putative 2OG-Fe(II) oxygenase [Streptomyces sp. NPDC050804]|uniref:putative 2OG-Fe(II) oxygenase n=1 Tax=unclassified Streptomyces TaxID=2593676 RepID=UPI0034129777|nr:2OG-Fe(II) oxygenase family protein [Streptomyces sp. NBC_00872]
MTNVAPKATTFLTWPTPFYQADLAAMDGPGLGPETITEMNNQLRTLILDAEKNQTEYTFGVIGAQKSSLDILRWNHPAVDWLRGRILSAIRDLTRDCLSDKEDLAATVFEKSEIVAEGWAVVYHEGGSHRQHTHHDSVFSGTYYIETGGVGPEAGLLQLLDPRPAAVARQASPGVYAVQPRPGILVGFPSWLPHSVKATLHGDGTRICIAWNAGLKTTEALS